MATYFVRKTGNDGNGGLSAGDAFLTIDHAANTVSAADIVRIGAGVYRETVTLDTDGANGSPIQWIADIDGAQTGDPGLVIITKYADEVGAGVASGSTLVISGKTYNEFYDIVFGPCGVSAADRVLSASTGDASYEGMVFDTCSFLRAPTSSRSTISLSYNAGAAMGAGDPITFDNCFFDGLAYFGVDDMLADIACGAHIHNCVFAMMDGTSAISIDGPTSDPGGGPTDFEIYNNTIIGYFSYDILIADMWGTGTIGRIQNNLFYGDRTSNNIQIAADGGAWVGGDNIAQNSTLSSGDYTGGGNDDTARNMMFGFQVEHIMAKHFGRSPWKAFEQVWDHMGSTFKSGAIDTGSATYAPADDFYAQPRLMGRQYDDSGAAETRRRAEQETTVVDEGSNAARFEGAGYLDIVLPVDASLTIVTVKGRFDSNYTGDKPIIRALNIPGVADQFDDMAGAADTWEQISCSFTPTAAGVVTIRLESRDTSATGKCYFDTMSVS